MKLGNIIGKNVFFNSNLAIKYNPRLIDNLKVYNRFLKQKDECEHWGWNSANEDNRVFHDFGRIADFNFDISKKLIRFYYGDGPLYGYYIDNPDKLLFFYNGEYPKEKFESMGNLLFEQFFPAPNSMWDLAMHIDSYIILRDLYIEEKIIEHSWKMNSNSPKEITYEESLDDLPF